MKLKICTFNLRVQVKNDGKNYFDNRRERILSSIKENSPDIIGFQEANDNMRAWLIGALDDYVVLGCGRKEDYSDEACAVAIRKNCFELISYETFWLSSSPHVAGSRYGEDQSNCPRVASALVLKHREGGAPFLFINTHLDHKGSVARLLGSVQLLQYISDKGLPTVLTGDFNALPDTREIQVITENPVCGLVDLTENVGGTFHGFGKLTGSEMNKIDYIFSNMKAYPNESFAIEDDGIDGVYISDHRPVYAFVEA